MMKKSLLIISLTSLWLCSCREHGEDALGHGWLQATVEQQSPEIRVVNTRAVSEGLAVDVTGITDPGFVYHFEGEQAGENLKNLELPAGEYTLAAYSTNKDATYGNTELGEPKWSAAKTFTIAEGAVNRVGLTVPMTNYAVTLTLPEGLNGWFSSILFTATSGSREITLNSQETAYFDPVEGADLVLTLNLQNTDGETFTAQKTLTASELRTGTVYRVQYDLRTQQLRLIR